MMDATVTQQEKNVQELKAQKQLLKKQDTK